MTNAFALALAATKGCEGVGLALTSGGAGGESTMLGWTVGAAVGGVAGFDSATLCCLASLFLLGAGSSINSRAGTSKRKCVHDELDDVKIGCIMDTASSLFAGDRKMTSTAKRMSCKENT